MLEILFILITFFIVYVIVSVATNSQQKKSEALDVKPGPSVTKVAVKEEKTAVKKETKKEKSSKPKLTKMPAGNLKNPETGDVDKIATSYRMLRRWIKDALVKEGLLEKVYKTSELNDETNQKINVALEKLKQMSNYQ